MLPYTEKKWHQKWELKVQLGVLEGRTGLELVESRKLEDKENPILKMNFKWGKKKEKHV